jgi:serine O-acetyltransferase
VDGENLPSKRAIGGIAADLLRLLFPGFFDEKPLHSSEIEAVTSELLDSVLGRLEEEIRKSLEYAPPAGLSDANLQGMARTLTFKFLGNLPRVRELLQTGRGGRVRRRPGRRQQGRSDRCVFVYRSHCGAAVGARTLSR